MSHMCKRVFKFELQLRSYWQNIKFSRYCSKFHIFIKIVIFQVYLQLFRPTASALYILWQGHIRNTLFHFCQLWAVNHIYIRYVSHNVQNDFKMRISTVDMTKISNIKNWDICWGHICSFRQVPPPLMWWVLYIYGT